MAMLLLQTVIIIMIIIFFGSKPVSSDEVCESVSGDPRPGPPDAMKFTFRTDLILIFDALSISSYGVITEIQYYIQTHKATAYIGFWRRGSGTTFSLVGKVLVQPTQLNTLYTQSVDPSINYIEVQPGDRGGIHGYDGDANPGIISGTSTTMSGISSSDIKTVYFIKPSQKDNGWAAGYTITTSATAQNTVAIKFNVTCLPTTTSIADTTSTQTTNAETTSMPSTNAETTSMPATNAESNSTQTTDAETTGAQNESASTHDPVKVIIYMFTLLVVIM